jgi:hypothetical protein
MSPSKFFIREIIQDPDNPDELLLDLGAEILEELGWQCGDTIVWREMEDGAWNLTKKS